MKRLLVFCVLAMAVLACSKDKFKTEPQVEIKSFGPDEVNNKQTFSLRAIVRDKEGDLKDSVIFYRKRFVGNTLLSQDSFIRYSLQTFAFQPTSEIEVQINFSYGEDRSPTYIFQNLESGSDKQLVVGMVIKDQAGHRSEYVESKRITLKKFP